MIGLVNHSAASDISPTLFLEYHCVASDYPITLNALYSVPGHHDASGGHEGSHITWNSSGGYMEDRSLLMYTYLMHLSISIHSHA